MVGRICNIFLPFTAPTHHDAVFFLLLFFSSFSPPSQWIDVWIVVLTSAPGPLPSLTVETDIPAPSVMDATVEIRGKKRGAVGYEKMVICAKKKGKCDSVAALALHSRKKKFNCTGCRSHTHRYIYASRLLTSTKKAHVCIERRVSEQKFFKKSNSKLVR